MTLKDKIKDFLPAVTGWSIVGGIIGGFFFGIPYACTSHIRHLAGLYSESQKPIIATVTKEQYENTLSPVPERQIDGLVSQAYSNETVKLNSKYTLKIRREDNGKVLALSVIDGGNIKKEALDMLIKEGSIIYFPKGNLTQPERMMFWKISRRLSGESWITEDTNTGTKRADRIRVK